MPSSAQESVSTDVAGPPVEPFELRIRPNRSWIRIDWRGLWEYRDLVYLMVRRDFVSKYSQTVLGPIWFVIQPVLTTFLFTVIFGRVAKLPTDGLPPALFYMCGMLAWGYFANTFGGTSSTLISNAGLFGKVYFPRLVVPLSLLLSNLFAFAIQFALFLLYYLYFKYFTAAGGQFGARLGILALPLLVLQVGAIGMGVGLWVSALTVKYRDFSHISSFLLNLWFYGTPVIFPLSLVPERWKWLVIVNPMTVPEEAFRYLLLGSGYLDVASTLVSLATTVALLLGGLLAFHKVERTFLDTV